MTQDPLQQTPPHDLDAEQATLGGTLVSAAAIGDVVEILRASDFYRPAHGLVFEIVSDLYSRGEPVDAISVTAELSRRGELDRIGGPSYLHTLISTVPTAANAGYYARIVAERAVKRRVAEAGHTIVRAGMSPAIPADDAAEQAEAALHAALGRADNGEGPTPLSASLSATLDRLEARERGEDLSGVPTGFADLDAVTHGFQPGQLIVVAARPGVGKSSLALDVARAAAIRHGRPVLFASLEMSRAELDERVLAAEATVSLQGIRTGRIGDAWERISRKIGELAGAPLHIDASPGLSVAAIRTRARRMQRRTGLDLLVVDYLQLLVTAGKSENRQQEISAISRSLKLLAAELGIPVVALSQLNRAVEQRADKRPQLSDLRDSGAIEQDADLVILIHREDAHNPNSARAGEADLIIAKNRNGPTGVVTVAFQGYYSRFVDMAS